MLAGTLSFLDTYNLSSLGCNSLCIVIKFFVLWYICLISSLVHFRNSFEYLIRGTARMLITLMRFLRQISVLRRFLVCLRNLSKFSFISACLLMSTTSINKFLFLILSWFGSSVLLFVFANFHYDGCTFFHAKFRSHIQAVSSSLYQGLHLLFF